MHSYYKSIFYLLGKSKGFITVKWTNLFFFGPPMSGKSSLLRMLLNEDPNDKYRSTPIVAAPIIIMTKTSESSERPKQSWYKIGCNSLKDLIKEETDSQIHLIYAIDTGGQAVFLDVAHALLQSNSVSIVTHNLTEKLEDIPKLYFTVKGRSVSVPVKQRINNLQYLQSSFRSLYSMKKEVHEIHSKATLNVLGTFFKESIYSEESIRKKNEVLWEKAEHFQMVSRYQVSTEKVIFPIDTTIRGDDDMIMANHLRHRICQSYSENKIPVNWLLLQMELENLQENSQTKLVSLDKCLNIGITLGMKYDEVKDALLHYHELTIFQYFPDILPNVVFLHPLPLLEKLSELIAVSIPEAVDFLAKEFGIYIPYEDHELMKKYGVFKDHLLTEHLSEDFDKENFTAEKYLELLKHLKIVAPLPHAGEYFLPTALPITEDLDSLTVLFGNEVDPLILTWNLKVFSRGLFPALIVQLLQLKCSASPSKYIQFDMQHCLTIANKQQHRNAIHLKCIDEPTLILLIDHVNSIEIHCSGPSTICYYIRNTIRSVIENELAEPSPQDCFYCSCSCDQPKHYCHVDKGKLTCDKRFPARDMTPKQQAWFKGIYQIVITYKLNKKYCYLNVFIFLRHFCRVTS